MVKKFEYKKIFLILILIACILLFSCCRDNDFTHNDNNTVLNEYILNTNSKKIHKVTCGTAGLMSERNRREYRGDIEVLLSLGYTVCGNCF